jgi:hypothetical protein
MAAQKISQLSDTDYKLSYSYLNDSLHANIDAQSTLDNASDYSTNTAAILAQIAKLNQKYTVLKQQFDWFNTNANQSVVPPDAADATAVEALMNQADKLTSASLTTLAALSFTNSVLSTAKPLLTA